MGPRLSLCERARAPQRGWGVQGSEHKGWLARACLKTATGHDLPTPHSQKPARMQQRQGEQQGSWFKGSWFKDSPSSQPSE